MKQDIRLNIELSIVSLFVILWICVCLYGLNELGKGTVKTNIEQVIRGLR